MSWSQVRLDAPRRPQCATIASTVTDLLPIIAIILGVLVLNESVTVLIVAGIVLILIGAALTRTRESAGAADRARVNQLSGNR